MQLWTEPRASLIVSESALDLLCEELEDAINSGIPICNDVETTGPISESGLDPYHGWLLGIGLSTSKLQTHYIPLAHTKQGVPLKEQLPLSIVRDKLNPVLSKKCVILAHNAKFDYKFQWRSGIRLYPNFWDTMIALQLLNGNSAKTTKLKSVIKNFVNIPPHKILLFDDIANGEQAEVSPETFLKYVSGDLVYPRYIMESIKDRIDREYPKIFYEAEMPLISILAHMEMRGIRIDVKFFDEIKGPLERYVEKVKQYFKTTYNFEISSPDQLSTYLTENFDDETLFRTTKTNKISTKAQNLKIMKRDNDRDTDAHRLSKHILKYREVESVLDKYVNKFPKMCDQYYVDGIPIYIIHPNFRQIINSGRLSSSPNVQNLKRDASLVNIRDGFVARDDFWFVKNDWASAEYKLIALQSKDPVMYEAYRNDPIGTDFHRMAAQGLFGVEDPTSEQRYKGKTFNFSAIYMATAYSISKTLNCTLEEAQEYLDNYFARYKGFKNWVEEIKVEIRKNRYTSTLWGRKRYLPDSIHYGMDEFWKYDGAVRQLFNHKTQGSCADMLKFSMVRIAKEFAKQKMYNSWICNNVHDEIDVETDQPDKALEIMKSVMEVEIDGILFNTDGKIGKTMSKAA